ncbi:MAG: chemotaxis protein CheW [Myxococcales bacterium]|nr:chemotaxis protein CheW [Myxococcales bacterium]
MTGRGSQLAPTSSAAHVLAPRDGIVELLAFRLGTDSYALPLACVREIVRIPPVTPVPRAAAHVLGVVSVRGRITTLVDLRRRVRVEASPPGRTARVLVVETGAELVGLLVDEVRQVHRLHESEIELVTSLGGVTPDHVLGIGRPGTARPARGERRSGQDDARSDELLVLLDPAVLAR